jgi:HK97 family phage prohead protease
MIHAIERRMTNGIERRFVASKLNLRAAPAGVDSPGILEGYAAKFNSDSRDLGGFIESIAPGAFDRALREKHDVRCLYNHDQNVVLGRYPRTLGLSVDSVGLRFSCTLPPTQDGRDVHTLISRGDVSQCSFAFNVPDGGDEWNYSRTRRTLRDVTLFDVSAVTYPAYEDTSVSARSLRIDYGSSDDIAAIRARAAEWGRRIAQDDAPERAQSVLRSAPDQSFRIWLP